MIAVVTSGKGGVGKSTVCAGLAFALAKQGQRVLLIDTDAGLRSLDYMLGVADRTVFDLADILSRECDPQSAIYQSPLCENLFVIPAPATPIVIDPEEMRYLCGGLAEHYDTVLIDCPAGLGSGFRAAVAAADRAILVTTPDPICAQDAYITSTHLDRENLSYKMIVNRLRPRAVKKGLLLNIDEVMDAAQVPLLGVIPEDEALTFATANAAAFPEKSPSAVCFRNIAARFTGQAVPLAKIK